jgi:hypothetical protein
MEIPNNLKDEIWNYCRTNNITNIDEFTLRLLTQGFTIEKFGATPKTNVIEKEVEKIIEVPVEKIIEKEVYITDDSQAKFLADKVVTLEEELESIRKNYKKEIETYQAQVVKLTGELDTIKKNKNDIYGE